MATLSRTLGSDAWGHLLLSWLALATVMSLNGIFRELALRPTLGARTAAILSAVLGISLVLAVTRLLFPPLWAVDTRSLVLASLALVVLTMAFETALGIFVDHKSGEALIRHYAIWRGELWPVVLAVLAATPFIWSRWGTPH